MKLTVSCQLCGKVLLIAEKDDNFSADDINNYEQSCFCTTLQSDGVTQDGQSSIVVSKTVE